MGDYRDQAVSVEAILDPRAQARLQELGSDLRTEVSALYLQDLPKRLESLRDAAEAGDLVAVAFAAHAIKGSSGEVGALVVRAQADALERAAGRGILPDPAQLHALGSAVNDVGLALSQSTFPRLP